MLEEIFQNSPFFLKVQNLWQQIINNKWQTIWAVKVQFGCQDDGVTFQDKQWSVRPRERGGGAATQRHRDRSWGPGEGWLSMGTWDYTYVMTGHYCTVWPLSLFYNSPVTTDKKETSPRLDKYITFIRGRLTMLPNDYWEYASGQHCAMILGIWLWPQTRWNKIFLNNGS